MSTEEAGDGARPGRRHRLVERTRVVRWALAVVLALAGLAAVATGVAQVCADVVSAGSVREACAPPRAGDGVTLGFALLLLLLLVPDVGEVSVPGLLALRSRLSAQEDRLAALDAQLSAVTTQLSSASAVGGGAVVNVLSGVHTGRFAVEGGEGPERAPPAAAVAVAGSRAHDVTEALDRARYVAAELLTAHLGDLGSGELADANLRLYLPADDGRTLRPVLEEPGSRRYADDWPSGQGAVGRAWRDGEIVVARGAEVTQGLGSLGPERAARYRDLAVVVALPVFAAARRPVAVLSASSRDPASELDGDELLSELLAATEVVARMLVDLLGWAVDT